MKIIIFLLNVSIFKYSPANASEEKFYWLDSTALEKSGSFSLMNGPDYDSAIATHLDRCVKMQAEPGKLILC